MPAARARSTPLMSDREATTTWTCASSRFASISSMRFCSVVPPPLIRTASLIGLLLMRLFRSLSHRIRIPAREVGELGIGADVGAALPASGTGLVCLAAVNDFDGDGGAFGAFFGEAVVVGADDIFEVRAEGLEAA